MRSNPAWSDGIIKCRLRWTIFRPFPAGQKPSVERVDKEINFASTLEAFPGTKLVDNFYVNWTGVIRIPKDGAYIFHLESDDGSRLFIDGKQVVDHGGTHEMTEMSGRAELKAGDHEIKVEFFDAEEEAGCILSWETAGDEPRKWCPPPVLFHKAAGGGAGTFGGILPDGGGHRGFSRFSGEQVARPQARGQEHQL